MQNTRSRSHAQQNKEAFSKKPNQNFYKINTNVNLSEANTWGLAAICRNENSEVLAATKWRMMGFKLVTEFAAQCGFMDVIFESDNEKIIRVLTAKETIPNLYVGNVIIGITLRKGRFRMVVFSHVDRKDNGLTHRLAQHALTEPNKIWLEETPSCIVTEVLWDIFNQ